MHARLLALSLAPLFAGSLAYAQAPGEVLPPAAGPAPEGPCGAACGCSHESPAESVMANRWAVGLSVGQLSLAPETSPDSKTDFGVGELALRFRATPHFELELAVGGGREQLADNQQGDREVSAALLAARYRFRAEAAWNWFLMGGIGGASVTRHDATKQERDDATHPMAMFGIGLERRFRHFALQAEARAIGIGDKERNDDVVYEQAAPPDVMPTKIAPPASQKQSGGSLSIGLSYYF